MRPFLCLLLIASATAVETMPVPVLRVIDGNTIEVGADLGGVQEPVRVRLAYIESPPLELDANGNEAGPGHQANLILADVLRTTNEVRLWAPGETLLVDPAIGECSAILLIGRTSVIPATAEPDHSATIQGWMLAIGQAVYPEEGTAPAPWHRGFLAAQSKARQGNQGAWATAPRWMHDKAERKISADGEAMIAPPTRPPTPQRIRPLLWPLLMQIDSTVETKPVPVLRVIDGNTIEVQADLGGQPYPMRVRLRYIATPSDEPTDHAMPEGAAAADALRKILFSPHGGKPDDPKVSLSSEGQALARDSDGLVLATIFYDAWNNGSDTGPTAGMLQKSEHCVNMEMIRAGWSPLWRKHGDPPNYLAAGLIGAEEQARAESAGAWATAPQWMQDKANERPEPKDEKP